MFCTHGNSIKHCSSCKPKQEKLKVRWNWQLNCWQLWGFNHTGSSIVSWKWIAVETEWVKSGIDAGRIEVLVDQTVEDYPTMGVAP